MSLRLVRTILRDKRDPAASRDLAPYSTFPWVNRSVVIVRPRAPFIDWINAHPDTDDAIRAQEHEPNVYLVPPVEVAADVAAWVDENATTIFEAELANWYRDRACWPADRGAAAFRDWFDVSTCAEVVDAAREPLKRG